MSILTRWFRLSFVLASVYSCANLVGIHDAELDPEFASGGTSAGGGAGPTSGGASGGGGAGEAGAGGASDPTLLCPVYCSTVMQNCTGATQVYESQTVCLRVCQTLERGTPGDTSGNSVACRLFHANQIELIGEEESECPAAGPGGDGVCGTNCEGYCALLRGICPAHAASDCETSCASVEDLGGYNASQTSGNTLQCRLYHVSAATIDANFHCPHAAGQGPCSG